MVVTIQWTGPLDWNTGLDYWTHTFSGFYTFGCLDSVEWNGELGMDLEWWNEMVISWVLLIGFHLRL